MSCALALVLNGERREDSKIVFDEVLSHTVPLGSTSSLGVFNTLLECLVGVAQGRIYECRRLSSRDLDFSVSIEREEILNIFSIANRGDIGERVNCGRYHGNRHIDTLEQ